jgi:hypothetical protein
VLLGSPSRRTCSPLADEGVVDRRPIYPVFGVNDACYFDVHDSKRPIGFSAANR